MTRRRTEYEVLPLREELESLVHAYQHLHNEHKRVAPESSTRRHVEERMLEMRQHFERALSEWIPDEKLQESWQAHLDNRGPAPAEPDAIQPVVFRGVSDETARRSRSAAAATRRKGFRPRISRTSSGP